MALQDFLDGGFLGKLGQVVGQRINGVRIVRTYTKGTNPRTPEQQANRGVFAHAVHLAQQAMNINGHDGLWDTSQKPEFSQRVGLAMTRLKAGLPDDQAIPLYPPGYNPAVDVNLISVSVDPAGSNMRLKFDLPTGHAAKTLKLTATVPGPQEWILEYRQDVLLPIAADDTVNLRDWISQDISSDVPAFDLKAGVFLDQAGNEITTLAFKAPPRDAATFYTRPLPNEYTETDEALQINSVGLISGKFRFGCSITSNVQTGYRGYIVGNWYILDDQGNEVNYLTFERTARTLNPGALVEIDTPTTPSQRLEANFRYVIVPENPESTIVYGYSGSFDNL